MTNLADEIEDDEDRCGACDALYDDEGDCPECDVCASEDCDEKTTDGEGFDGYCGNCADRREAAGVYAHHD